MGMMRDIFASERLDCLLWNTLQESNPRDRVYVYRVVDGRPVKPALIIGEPFPELMECLRDEHGGGRFQLMIRRGEKMLLSGTVSVCTSKRVAAAT